VHRSNFTLEGFVSSVAVRDLVPIAAEAGIPVLHDFGSGLMMDLSPWGLSGEPTARDAVAAGATLVMMSGDKLLGGPQAGVIVGSAAAIGALHRNPLARALRVDKMTLAALEATLALYRDPSRAVAAIPTLAMLTAPLMALEARAGRLVAVLTANGMSQVARVARTSATVGGGAFPGAAIPSAAITLEVASPDALEAKLRGGTVPVIGRIADGKVVLDLRSVNAELDDELGSLIAKALA
jgi:L-seryl-tRNA(Ser) seleniumtransferase